jgi:triacylglycerol lipase
MAYPYDPSRAALLTPARGAVFFPAGRPATEAALCAELSRLAYAPFERDPEASRKVQDALRRVGFAPGYLFSAGGTQGFLATDADRSVSALAFRGTEVNPRDWATDLRAWPCDWVEGGQVHEGFAAALAVVWSDLAPRLADAPGRRIYTGHSLGAALATLAASHRPPHALYTYGSPRVGDEAFLRTLSAFESHRFTNCCDMICRVPPEAFGYRHHGPASYIDREGAVHVPPADAEVTRDHLRARLAYSWRWAWRPGNVWTRDLADHAPVNYCSALRAGGPPSSSS